MTIRRFTIAAIAAAAVALVAAGAAAAISSSPDGNRGHYQLKLDGAGGCSANAPSPAARAGRRGPHLPRRRSRSGRSRSAARISRRA